jgi:hypothetical protein
MGHLPGCLSHQALIHLRWKRHRHSSRAIGTPTSNSSRQMVHSAESTQSFSVARYGNIPVLLGGTGGEVAPPGAAPCAPVEADPGGGVPLLPYILWAVMQMVIWASRRASKLGSERCGSSRWHTGHSSSSAICGGGGIGGSRLWLAGAEDDPAALDDPASKMVRTRVAAYGYGWCRCADDDAG